VLFRSVHGNDKIELASGKRRSERVDVVGISMDVLNLGRGLGTFMGAPVQNRDPMATINQPLHNMNTRRARSPDDQTRSHFSP
jgi:hypothetical protein